VATIFVCEVAKQRNERDVVYGRLKKCEVRKGWSLLALGKYLASCV
jgi:hypothetical protein